AQIDLRPAETDRLELDRAVECDAVDLGAIDVANRFPAAGKRHDSDVVIDPMIEESEGKRAPWADVLDPFQIDFPGLLRPELVIAGIGVVVGKIHIGQKVTEVELADAARDPERNVVPAHG